MPARCREEAAGRRTRAAVGLRVQGEESARAQARPSNTCEFNWRGPEGDCTTGPASADGEPCYRLPEGARRVTFEITHDARSDHISPERLQWAAHRSRAPHSGRLDRAACRAGTEHRGRRGGVPRTRT